jgi:hypothetical protein
MLAYVAAYLATDVNNDSKMFVTLAPDEGATTFSIMIISIMTISIMTLSIMTLSIINLFVTFSVKNIEHCDTKHKH